MTEHWNKQTSISVVWHRYRWVWRGVVAAAAVGLVGLFAFFQTFSTFAGYDDEGYFLQAYHDFLSGRIPYDQVSSIYGPFSFASAALIARFHAANVTHDTFRWALLPVWLAIATLIAGVVWRWTGRFSATIAAFLLAGLNVSLASEIGHPQPSILLAIALLVWVGFDWIYQPERRRNAFWTGFLVGVALLCKINIGIFEFVAIALAVSLQLRGRLRLIACGMSIIVAAGLGFFVLPAASRGSEKFFVFAYLGSLIMTAGFAFFRTSRNRLSLNGLGWLGAGLGTCLCVGVCVTLAWGTTVGAQYQALVTEPSHWKSAFHLRFLISETTAVRSGIGIVAAIVVFIWRRRFNLQSSWLGLVKVAVASWLFFWLYYDPRSALTVSLLFLWLLIVDTQPMTDVQYSNRLLLALLCPLFSLQILPIAGLQVTWATLMQISAAAVLLGDGIHSIERGEVRMRSSKLICTAAQAVGPCLAVLLFLFVGKQAIWQYHHWRDSQSLDLPGAHWLRLPPAEKNILTSTVSELKQNCQTVLMIPGVYSFSLWSGVPAAEEKKLNTWPFLWPDEVQKNELPKVRAQAKGCVLVTMDNYNSWKYISTFKGKDELLTEVQRTMQPIFRIDDVTLYRSPQKPNAPLNSAVEIDQHR